VPSYLISATVLGVLAQRLVRTLCPHCKQPDEDFSRDTLAAAIAPWRMSGAFRPYRPVGCIECRMTGFQGRTGLYELLTVTEALKPHLTQTPDLSRLRQQATQDGMRPLRLAGAMKVAEGLTTLDEVLRATPAWEG
jgi:general secretion pathway protein E